MTAPLISLFENKVILLHPLEASKASMISSERMLVCPFSCQVNLHVFSRRSASLGVKPLSVIR
jgi:hypothetical protein